MPQRITVAMIERRIAYANSLAGGEPFVLDSGHGMRGVMRGGKRIVSLAPTSSCYYEFCAYISGLHDGMEAEKARAKAQS